MPETLHGVVEAIAASAGSSVALIHGDRRITYRQLDRAATTYAHHLRKYEVGPGDLVPVLLPRSPELIAAMLGVLKTGAAYANLDVDWPAARITDVLDQLRPKAAVTSRPAPLGVPTWIAPACEQAAADAAGDEAAAAEPGAADAVACVFFTSGTTGRPKGVLSPHQGTLRLFAADTFAAFDAGTVIPVAAPTPWDGFSLEIWAALVNGGCAVLVEEPFLTPQALRDGVGRHGVNTVWLTSGLFNTIVDEDLGAFGGIGQLMIGGERLSPPHVRRFLAAYPQTALINGYGPVESTVFATTHRIRPQDCDLPAGIPIGRAVPRTGLHILDGDRPCAPGEPGELCISGDGLAAGYLGLPEQTAEKFPDIVLNGIAVRVYRTGDIAVRDETGLLHYRGRADRQVKIRGHRIEPAEVERQIEACLPVRRCAVVAQSDDQGAVQGLLAFCIPLQAGDPLSDAAEILARELVTYHRPAMVVSVDGFPLTANGKLDERALLELAPRGPLAEPVAAPPTGPVDALTQQVMDTFADVLGHQGPPDHTFADLGGSSLAAVRVCARLAARLDRPVPVTALTEHPTARALAAHLRATAGDQTSVPEPAPDRFPLSATESSFLTQSLLDPASRGAHCLGTWIITGDLDPAALSAAIADVHARHPALHAEYGHQRGRLFRVPGQAPPPEPIMLPSADSTEAAVTSLRAALAGPFSPVDGLLWRAVLAPVAGTRTTIFGYVVHHIAFDGWSESVLATDLATAYNARLTGQKPRWAPGADLATVHLLRSAHRAAVDLEAQVERRVTALRGLPDMPFPAGATAPGGELTHLVREIGPDDAAAVEKTADRLGRTPFQLLLWLYGRALATRTGSRDFGVGVPVAQRIDARLEDAVGCHITMACVRLRGAALGSDHAALAAATDLIGEALRDQDASIPDLVRELNPPRTARAPLFQTIFAVQNNDAPHLALHGADATFVRQPYLGVPTELQTEVWPHETGLRLVLTANPAAIADTFTHALADTFTDLIRHVADLTA
ncbi:amino acid adenylation domain-containing protein [Actinoplanes sp. KI2]|uniref:amino acid adenylation domain-containing protein n=1 Tax=Actinoplanes sp. KI2 TaxID=2983315 RepID=UPI0021D5EC24|nr:amino acid adenylation domain-containing protein [Actinoplanes sp. KI2]MCU7729688.1 amino acid adenylation domain-containing protein [Actinoplanes sp. KI2]